MPVTSPARAPTAPPQWSLPRSCQFRRHQREGPPRAASLGQRLPLLLNKLNIGHRNKQPPQPRRRFRLFRLHKVFCPWPAAPGRIPSPCPHPPSARRSTAEHRTRPACSSVTAPAQAPPRQHQQRGGGSGSPPDSRAAPTAGQPPPPGPPGLASRPPAAAPWRRGGGAGMASSSSGSPLHRGTGVAVAPLGMSRGPRNGTAGSSLDVDTQGSVMLDDSLVN